VANIWGCSSFRGLFAHANFDKVGALLAEELLVECLLEAIDPRVREAKLHLISLFWLL
jgi:hypothetical protein